MDLDGKGMLTSDVMHTGLFAAAWDIDRVLGLFDKVDQDEDGCISKVLLCLRSDTQPHQHAYMSEEDARSNTQQMLETHVEKKIPTHTYSPLAPHCTHRMNF